MHESEHRDDRIARALADLSVPPESPEFFTELRARAERRRALPAAWGLRVLAARRPLAVVIATAVVFAAIGAVAGIAAPRSEKAPPPPVLAFAPAGGWNTAQSRDPGNARVEFVWAANGPFAGDDSVTGEPVHTAKALGHGGILVYASSLPTVPDASGYRDLRPPLRLSDGDFVTGQYENQPAPNVSKYMINAHVNGRYVFVEVLFGTPNPNAELRQAADEELARLQVPATSS
jgi:hypothetical protein